ncbi:hypothetical protein GQ473_01390, partial [archaeon]|nr:hypothetical protein [archaeon]
MQLNSKNNILELVITILIAGILIWALIIQPIIEWIKQNIIILGIITIIIISIILFLLPSYLKNSEKIAEEYKKETSKQKSKKIKEIKVENRIKWDRENRIDEERNILAEKIYDTNIEKKENNLLGIKQKKIRIPIPGKLKTQIFERAGHRCQKCGRDTTPQIHHIDKNPSNNHLSNLIVLCPTHH